MIVSPICISRPIPIGGCGACVVRMVGMFTFAVSAPLQSPFSKVNSIFRVPDSVIGVGQASSGKPKFQRSGSQFPADASPDTLLSEYFAFSIVIHINTMLFQVFNFFFSAQFEIADRGQVLSALGTRDRSYQTVPDRCLHPGRPCATYFSTDLL